MANDLNQCSFIGRLGADPETRFTQSGDPVCSFRVAVGWKSKEKEGAEWVSFTAFGKLAEICGEYLKKGAQVFCQGRWKTDKFTDKEGQEKYSTKIILEQMQMLGKKEGASDNNEPPVDYPKPKAQKPSVDDLDDSIPF